MQEDLRPVRGAAAVGGAAVGARRQVRRPRRPNEVQDKELRGQCGDVEDVREAVQEEQVEEQVPCRRLRPILRAPSGPVVLVRDRDRVYGDCLPKSPQPATRAWQSSTRVRQALRPTSTGLSPPTRFMDNRALRRRRVAACRATTRHTQHLYRGGERPHAQLRQPQEDGTDGVREGKRGWAVRVFGRSRREGSPSG